MAEPKPPTTQDLANWWLEETKSELKSVIPKAVEYGSSDLKVIGFALEQMSGKPAQVTHDELGIAFYVLGKVARLIGGYADGRAPSDDTWHDIAIYTKMAQYARENGGWGGFVE
ncbi:hypothetical protein UFOVP1462_7 [uncultured Caudovirales phage]|uniref:Uncharacterized protein n=1 Tax=uncultured Caudovirales phage TaxID=2100421 RepID=A0A6J5SJ82_9CAUD|nr:hypothetical protein UFOVP1013_7 [uncultured Caudovirales phage]CAB4202612.1 hypothetical protein UFOVP1364_24 [uncultured Caudovirales phage]CAB4213976.1 hypothetical protein UFOVP1462_7 [uncultured Caudovirales phage]CAB5228626.1 hypothetical protein UFOVP1550_16 [uncultured Caudovirales phage]